MLVPLRDKISIVVALTRDSQDRHTRTVITENVPCYFADLLTVQKYEAYRVDQATTAVAIVDVTAGPKVQTGYELTVDGLDYVVQRRTPMKDLFGTLHGYVLTCRDK